MANATHREAATTLYRIADTLPMPASVRAYLRGYAEGLTASARRSRPKR